MLNYCAILLGVTFSGEEYVNCSVNSRVLIDLSGLSIDHSNDVVCLLIALPSLGANFGILFYMLQMGCFEKLQALFFKGNLLSFSRARNY